MITKLLKSPLAFFLVVFTISVICPLGGLYLKAVSCPEPAGLAAFPFASANCIGDFIGEVGVFGFGLPGLIALYGIFFLAPTLSDAFTKVTIDVPLLGLRLLSEEVLCLGLNFIIYFSCFSGLRHMRKRIKEYRN